MNDTIYIVTGIDDDDNTTILGVYPAYNMALERMDFAAKLGRWRKITSNEVKVTPYGVDTEITL